MVLSSHIPADIKRLLTLGGLHACCEYYIIVLIIYGIICYDTMVSKQERAWDGRWRATAGETVTEALSPKQNVKYNKKKHKKSKWMTQAILNSINMKDVLYKKFIQANNEDENIYSALKEEYTRYRKTLRHSIREAKKMYNTRTFNIYKNDMKTTWKIINDTLRRKSSTSCDAHFISNGQIIKNHDEIADQFNHFFISIGSKLSREIQSMNDHKQYLRNPTES